MKNIFKDLKRRDHKRYLGGLDVFKYIGPGLLVTVGFIDPGNWASNFAAVCFGFICCGFCRCSGWGCIISVR